MNRYRLKYLEPKRPCASHAPALSPLSTILIARDTRSPSAFHLTEINCHSFVTLVHHSSPSRKMKATTVSVALLSLVSTAIAQTLPPAPTESVGCEPHGDHWHCAGPAPKPSSGAVTQTSAAPTQTGAHDDHDDHDHETGSGVLPPSPTASVGCEPHGDHWHCAGPKPASTTSAPAASSSAAGGDHGAGTGVLPPSPSASTGCEPHGDHWHCAGPKVTSSSAPAPSASGARNSTTTPPPVAAAAGAVVVPVAGLVGIVAMVL